MLTPSDPTNQGPAAPSPAVGGAMDRPIARRGRNRRTVWIATGVAVAAVALLWAFLVPPPGSLTVKAASLETGITQPAPFQDYLPVRAEVAPLQTVLLSAVSGGQVAKVIVLDGAKVGAGEALANLTNPQLELDVTSKEADIAGRMGDTSAQALALERNRLDSQKEVSDTNYSLLKSSHDLEVRQRLHDQGFVSDAEVKTYAAEAAYYAARLDALKKGQSRETAIAAAQALQIASTSQRLKGNLGVVQASLDALTLRAPVAGRLTGFTLQVGQTLKAGDAVGQIDSEGAYKVIADVDEFYLGRVVAGQKASADIDGHGVALTVSRVLPQVTSGRFRAELTFDQGPPGGLRRGEAVDIRVTLGETRTALVVPNGAWMDAGGGAYAFVMRSNSRADRRAITVGRRNPEQVEITSGLRPGERIVTSSYAGYEKFSHLIIH